MKQYPQIDPTIKDSNFDIAYCWYNDGHTIKKQESNLNPSFLKIDEFNEWQIEERIKTGAYLEEN